MTTEENRRQLEESALRRDFERLLATYPEAERRAIQQLLKVLDEAVERRTFAGGPAGCRPGDFPDCMTDCFYANSDNCPFH